MKRSFSKEMIAPCGINCGLCLAFLREKNQCAGCWSSGNTKPKSCINCIIKNCDHLASNGSKFCYDCPVYPCKRMKQLDKRYRLKYDLGLIENHRHIKEFGMAAFLKMESEKWKCPACGGRICMHKGFCLDCEKQKKNKEVTHS